MKRNFTKKFLTVLCAMCVCGSVIAAETATAPSFSSWLNQKVNEITAPIAEKEAEAQAKQAEIEKAQKARQAEIEKAQKEQEAALAAKKAELEKAQKEREAAAAAQKEQINKDVDNLKKSIDAFKKYGK